MTGSSFLDHFILRHHDLGEHHDKIMMQIRVARECLKEREGNAQLWVELANTLNMCAMHAESRKRPDWTEILQLMANAMREIENRVRRVGGRYAARDEELGPITLGLNLIDVEILPTMTATEWNYYSEKMITLYTEEMERREKENAVNGSQQPEPV